MGHHGGSSWFVVSMSCVIDMTGVSSAVTSCPQTEHELCVRGGQLEDPEVVEGGDGVSEEGLVGGSVRVVQGLVEDVLE